MPLELAKRYGTSINQASSWIARVLRVVLMSSTL